MNQSAKPIQINEDIKAKGDNFCFYKVGRAITKRGAKDKIISHFGTTNNIFADCSFKICSCENCYLTIFHYPVIAFFLFFDVFNYLLQIFLAQYSYSKRNLAIYRQINSQKYVDGYLNNQRDRQQRRKIARKIYRQPGRKVYLMIGVQIKT